MKQSNGSEVKHLGRRDRPNRCFLNVKNTWGKMNSRGSLLTGNSSFREKNSGNGNQ
jgi:hypothetical protein